MKILFLDQSGNLGGAELALCDIAQVYREGCLVGLLSDGPFKELLESHQIPVQILTHQTLSVRKDSNFLQVIRNANALFTPIKRVVELSQRCDLIYANTQKALVVGAISSFLSQCPLVYHLHDIVSPQHFSAINRQIIVTLANQFAALVIANSDATKTAFEQAGGRSPAYVVYNGFAPATYVASPAKCVQLRQQLGIDHRFVVGHFSRLAPWKGQHVLLEALKHCPENVVALLVGDALFGEQDYVDQLHRQVHQLGLGDRVQFLGFRSDIPSLMAACDLVAHTSTAPEPFGRVIVEAMLCGTPVVATGAGGAIELIEHGKTGWLTPPGDAAKLAEIIHHCYQEPEPSREVARQAQRVAGDRFNLTTTNQQIAQLLAQIPGVVKSSTALRRWRSKV